MNSPLRIALALLLMVRISVAASPERPLDTLERTYRPYTDPGDSLAFAIKIQALSADPYKLWRGAKELFFIWTKSNCADWIADQSAYITVHADLHFGNIGTYAAAPKLGTVAAGMVDFDDACTLPFQFELLEEMITLKLVAAHNSIALAESQQEELIARVLAAYRSALRSDACAETLLRDNPIFRPLLEAHDEPYSAELPRFVSDRHFRTRIETAKGKLKEILRPATQPRDDFAAALADAVAHEPALKDRLHYSTREEFRGAILDAAQRLRLGSAGSQGLRKYLILLRSPLNDEAGDAILYLKQEIPSAAERSGIIPLAPLPPGQRVKEAISTLTNPNPIINSWCSLGDESYSLSLKDPWSEQLNDESIQTADELYAAAELLGTIAGTADRPFERKFHLSDKIDTTLAVALEQRSEAYYRQLNEEYRSLHADPRLPTWIEQADRGLQKMGAAR